MKTLRLKLTGLTIFLMIVFSACKKDASTGPQPTIVKGSVDQTLTQGAWRIGSFVDNGNDKTGLYTDFVIQFSTTGNVTASDPSSVFTGNWSASSGNHIMLMLNFINQGSFTDLTHNWTVTQSSSIQVKLEDVTNGNSDFLILNKDLIK